jgi:hypothetical protein
MATLSYLSREITKTYTNSEEERRPESILYKAKRKYYYPK